MPDQHLKRARLLVAIPAVFLAIVPVLADFNPTHAVNPAWPSHARLHAVWGVFSSSLISLLALFVLFRPRREPSRERVYLAAAMLGAVLGGFFLAGATQSVYGGAFTDPNGIPIRVGPLDANLAGFGVMAVVVAAGVLMARRHRPDDLDGRA